MSESEGQSAGESQSAGVDPALRPRNLGEYVGQDQIVENLRVYIRAALQRGEALDHVLLSGPPGLGKTTLAHIIGSELEATVHATSGPAIARDTTTRADRFFIGLPPSAASTPAARWSWTQALYRLP